MYHRTPHYWYQYKYYYSVGFWTDGIDRFDCVCNKAKIPELTEITLRLDSHEVLDPRLQKSTHNVRGRQLADQILGKVSGVLHGVPPLQKKKFAKICILP